MARRLDAVIVGAGPNGLAAAALLARAGRSVRVIEGGATPGGASRTEELTLPGYLHDVGSAIHPLGAASPCFRELDLEGAGLEWVSPPAAVAHPFDDRPAAVIEPSIEATAAGLGRDGDAYRRLFGPLAASWPDLAGVLLGPLRPPPLGAVGPLTRFGLAALRSARGLARSRFRGARARGLFAGLAGHSVLPLERVASAAVGLVLGVAAHRVGWPFPRGGAAGIVAALLRRLEEAGGVVETGTWVESLDELPPARVVLADVGPRQLLRLAGEGLPPGYRRALARYRYGPGIFKLDLALSGPVPWSDPACARAATVHLGGTLEEIAHGEREAWRGRIADRPFVLLAQPSLFDPGRAPQGGHTLWAYCHVPHGAPDDVTAAVEGQIERFAPGFSERIVARSAMTAPQVEAWNPNCVGGDITGGVTDLRQLFARPVLSRVPYATPVRGLYLCSSSTPPGGGVHGMCGYHAARAALARELAGGGRR
ncbi:MAG: NAD(P)/FAD-dependent oxidoreductase [Thermoanaerobaculia bacterium]|nr:NAD(P)/FAD-dependent oxidoreductase [Thermoanaerobaculia bacterium]